MGRAPVLRALEVSRRSAHPGRLLIVDDQPENIRLLTRILERAGYTEVESTTAPDEARALFTAFNPDLILLDFHMPRKDGFRVLEELSALMPEGDRLPILMLTGDARADIKRKALSLGATDFLRKPYDPAEVVLRIDNLLETHFLYQTVRRHNAELEHKVAQRTAALEQSQIEILERMAAVVEFRDDDTGDHTRRVGETSRALAESMGLPRAQIDLIRRAAPLHDIGKVGIPDSILLKAGVLSASDFEIMKTHTVIGSKLLSDGRSELIRLAQWIARSHHEWWDGSGYPDRLSSENIPLEARIVAVADFFDALTHDRPYRPAWDIDATLAEIRVRSGTHFDPEVAAAFLRMRWTSVPDRASSDKRVNTLSSA